MNSSDWISVDERMPYNGQSVAFVARFDSEDMAHWNGQVMGGRYFSACNKSFCVPGVSFDAWYWMPLPPAPGLNT